jgi:arylsulfatase
MHEMKFFNGILETPAEAVERIDDIGGPHSHTNYPWGWAQCGNTPFRWYKQNTHEGGVHVPFIAHWPARFGDQAGTRRDQFAAVSDVAPTIYDLVGVTPPRVYRGADQLPVTGRSFADILRDPAASAANRCQYFENGGSRALVAEQDGKWWKAVCRHVPGADFETEPWELYRLDDDWSECADLAGDDPDRLDGLIELWWSEAERHGVLPLDDRGVELFGARFREHSPHPPSREYRYRPPMSPIPAQAAASVGGRSFDLTARITGGPSDEGVLWATGTENSGISVFVQRGRLVVDYNAFDAHTVVESNVPVPAGTTDLHVRVRRTGARTGTLELVVAGETAGSAELPLFMRMISSVGPSIGFDHGSPVSGRYAAPNPYTGTLHQVDIRLVSRTAPDADAASAQSEMSRQ